MHLPVINSVHFGLKEPIKIGPNRLPDFVFPLETEPKRNQPDTKEKATFRHDVPFNWIA
jgi:hypothetical protein